MASNDDLLTTEEAAALAGVSARTLIRWRDQRGLLASVETRRPVVESRPVIGWRREDVLRAAGKLEQQIEPEV